MTTNGNGGGGHVDTKALRMLALEAFRGDLTRIRSLVDSNDVDDPTFGLLANLAASAEKNLAIAFEASGSALRDNSTALAKRDEAQQQPKEPHEPGDPGPQEAPGTKALRMLALKYLRDDLGRIRALLDDRDAKDATFDLLANFVTSAEKNLAIAFNAGRGWLKQVYRSVRGAESNRHLIHARKGVVLVCDPEKTCWGNTFGKHCLKCEPCRNARDTGRIHDTAPEKAPAVTPEVAAAKRRQRSARLLRSEAKRNKMRVRAAG